MERRMLCSSKGPLPRRNRGSKRLHSAAGFTLIEVTMAGVVLVIALTASLFTLNRSFQVVDAARNDTLAAQIMQSEIERLRLMSWNDLVLLEANVQAAPEKRLDVDLSKIIPDASLRQRFENTQVTLQREAARDMMRITVTVRWTGHGGIAQERSFTTKYSRNGFYDYCYTIGHS